MATSIAEVVVMTSSSEICVCRKAAEVRSQDVLVWILGGVYKYPGR